MKPIVEVVFDPQGADHDQSKVCNQCTTKRYSRRRRYVMYQARKISNMHMHLRVRTKSVRRRYVADSPVATNLTMMMSLNRRRFHQLNASISGFSKSATHMARDATVVFRCSNVIIMMPKCGCIPVRTPGRSVEETDRTGTRPELPPDFRQSGPAPAQGMPGGAPL